MSILSKAKLVIKGFYMGRSVNSFTRTTKEIKTQNESLKKLTKNVILKNYIEEEEKADLDNKKELELKYNNARLASWILLVLLGILIPLSVYLTIHGTHLTYLPAIAFIPLVATKFIEASIVCWQIRTKRFGSLKEWFSAPKEWLP